MCHQYYPYYSTHPYSNYPYQMNGHMLYHYPFYQFGQQPYYVQQQEPYSVQSNVSNQDSMSNSNPTQENIINTQANIAAQVDAEAAFTHQFLNEHGQVDVNKMLTTVGQLAQTVQQVSPVIKQVNDIIQSFRV